MADPVQDRAGATRQANQATGSGRAQRGPTELATGHLWQVDVVRLLTFAAVIAVHAIDFTQPASSRPAAAALMVLQFGREVFFSLSGFVLVYSALHKPIGALAFWRKRYPLVVLPYLTWILIYYFANLAAYGGSFQWSRLLIDIADGNAEYQMYFLLVTMQLYLVFPLLIRFIRATANHTIPVLVGAGVFNAAWFAVLKYVPAPPGWPSVVWGHAYEFLPTYVVYVLAGCYAAVHIEKIQAVVHRHARRLMAVSAVCASVAILVYAVQLSSMPPRIAGTVLQPAMIASCASSLIIVYVIGSKWASGPRRAEHAVAVGSDISFGVYLAHPLVLILLLTNGLHSGPSQVVPSALATVLCFFGAATGASLITLVARRTPLAVILTGRRRVRSDSSRWLRGRGEQLAATGSRRGGVPVSGAA